MTTPELSLYIMAIVAAMALGVRFLLKSYLQELTIKWLLIVSTVLIASLSVAALCSMQKIPQTASDIISASIVGIENRLGDEGVNTPIDVTDIKDLLSNYKNAESYIDENEHLSWLVDAIISRSLRNSASSLANHTETMIAKMEESGTLITAHNVLAYTANAANESIVRTTARWQRIFVILTALFDLFIVFMYYSVKKGWFTTRTSSVTFGEDIG